jgi:hypothetical protein
MIYLSGLSYYKKLNSSGYVIIVIQKLNYYSFYNLPNNNK